MTNKTPSEPQTQPTTETMSIPEMAALIEALLFVADHPVTLNELATTLDTTPHTIEKALATLNESYQQRYLRIQRLGKRVQLATTPSATPAIERFLGLSISSKLSPAALEALGIIAYKQPITRPEIEAIRGVSSDGVLRTLLSKGLIEVVGQLDTAGRPRQYGTTFEFLKYFGLASLDDMPPLAMDDPESPAENDGANSPS